MMTVDWQLYFIVFHDLAQACYLCDSLKLCTSCLSVGLERPTSLSILHKGFIQFESLEEHAGFHQA